MADDSRGANLVRMSVFPPDVSILTPDVSITTFIVGEKTTMMKGKE